MMKAHQQQPQLFRRSMSLKLDGPSSILHLDCNKQNNMVAVGGRAIFKIFSIRDDEASGGGSGGGSSAGFYEYINMRGNKSVNLNFSCNDVVWSHLEPSMLATAATNGAIVIWNLMSKTAKQRQLHIFHEHSRMVNKVNFHPVERNVLVSGSQDGTMRLFDIRMEDAVAKMQSGKESVRDVQWNQHFANQVLRQAFYRHFFFK